MFNYNCKYLPILIRNSKNANTSGYICISVFRDMCYLLSFVYLYVGCHANAVILPMGDVIFYQLACPVIAYKRWEQLTQLYINID